MDIFKLVGSVFVDTDKANESLAKTDKAAESTHGKFGKLAAGAGKMALGIGAAAVAAGGAILGVATKTAEAADEVDKGSKRMGISTDEFQKLRYAAEQSGVEMSTLEKAAKKLEGTDINFDDAMNSIMQLGTAEERSAAAAELFGESVAYQMAPLLQESGQSFDDLKNRAEELGIVMSEDAVAAGVKMGDTMADVKKSFGGIVSTLGAEFMPVVQGVLDFILAHMPEIQAVVGEVMEFVRQAIEQLMPVIEALSPYVEKAFAIVKELWNGTLKPVLNEITSFLTNVFTGNFSGAFRNLVNMVGSIWQGIITIIKSPVNAIITLINKFIAGLNTIKIPDWVPGVGGKGLSINPIPMLAKGGDIVEGGRVLVGEQGPELLDLPQGARVTPLGKHAETTNIDYDKMAKAMIKALLAVAPHLKSEITPDTKGMFKEMQKEARIYKKTTGLEAFA